MRHFPTVIAAFRRWLAFALLAGSSGSHAQSDGSPRWAFSTLSTSTAGNIVASPAIAPDGTVYIGVEVGSATSANPSGRLFAINPDGTQKWVFTTSEWVDSTPAIAPDGTIYFGCWDGNFYALRPDGTTKWSWTADSYVSGSPALAADGTIYFGTGSGSLHALNPDGTLKWTFPTSDWIESSPAVGVDGTIYFGSWDDTVYAVAPNGVQKWEYLTGGDIVSSPAIAADGTIYVGSRDLSVYAFTPEGTVKWSVDTGDTVEASPTIGADGTIYVATTGGRIYAFNPDGTERWRFPAAGQAALNAIYSSAAVRADGSILFGSSNEGLYALNSNGTLRWKATLGDWADSSPAVGSDGSIYIGCSDKKLYAVAGNGQPLDPAAAWAAFRRNSLRTGRSPALTIALSPASQSIGLSGSETLNAVATAPEGPAPSYQWRYNGAALDNATSPTLTLTNFQPANSGLYAAAFASSATQAITDPAIVGLSSATKVEGNGFELGPNIKHPNGNTYDQILLQGAAAAITADAGQVTRISYVDLTNDIVQVEFSGAGTLSLVLESPSSPAPAAYYNQPSVSYVKGHAGIVITGADETTNVTVFSVGTATAHDQSLFRDDVDYDGMATIAYLAIHSANGRFGGIRTANTSYLGTKGFTGVYAPNVEFVGPVYVGDITAADDATPVLLLGSSTIVTQINGGDLLQQNQRPVQISGFSQLELVPGITSHAEALPAQTIQSQLQQNGAIVTDSVAVTKP